MPESDIFDNIPEHYPVDFILDNFDFEKVHRYMKYGKWTWMSANGVPSVAQLKNCARRLLEELRAKADDTWFISTGGLCASKHYNRLQLQFVIESWDEFELEDLGDELNEGWQS